MSSLISSILEPVIRHARGFSGASHGECAAGPAIPGGGLPSRAARRPPARHAMSLSADIHLVGRSIAAARDLAAAPLDAASPAAARDSTPPDVASPVAEASPSTAAGHANRTHSPPRTAPSSVTPSIFQDERSSNPAYGIPEPFRADSSPRLSVAQSRRNPGRAPSYPAVDSDLAVIMSESLPADDGMRLLRQRIHKIRELRLSNEDKAQRMHSLMTERYHALQASMSRPPSPPSFNSQERPFTPASTLSGTDIDMHGSSPASIYSAYDSDNPYNLTVEDLGPTFCPTPEHEQSAGRSADADDEEEEPNYGCKHYKRNVKIQCFDCHRWYTCRHCHDEKEDHNLNRSRTRNMLCMLCATAQPAAESCSSCQVRAAWYYCDICKLWDNDSTKSIYHCDDCGICRRGEGLGKDFIHCKRCNVCISIKYANDHRCIEHATDADCPICKDYMFTSSTDVVSMKCGHYMHRDCYEAYMQADYKCPMCKKSAVNMELQWRKLKDAIESQPMPVQFADTRVVIHCNDCSVKSTANYHWLGNQCAHCESFNTTEMSLQVGGEPEQDTDTGTPTNPAGLPSSPRSFLSPAPTIERRSSGSYFLLAEREEREAREREAARRPSSADGATFSPFEMLQRVRSLSPVRRFLRGSDDEMEDAFDDEDEDSDDSVDEDEDMDEDDELDDAGEDPFDSLDLIGHR